MWGEKQLNNLLVITESLKSSIKLVNNFHITIKIIKIITKYK